MGSPWVSSAHRQGRLWVLSSKALWWHSNTPVACLSSGHCPLSPSRPHPSHLVEAWGCTQSPFPGIISNSQLSLSCLGLSPNTVNPRKPGDSSLHPIPNANSLCSWFWKLPEDSEGSVSLPGFPFCSGGGAVVLLLGLWNPCPLPDSSSGLRCRQVSHCNGPWACLCLLHRFLQDRDH